MAKSSTATAPRRKSAKPSMIVTLKLPSALLQKISEPKNVKEEAKEESPAKDTSVLLKPPVAATSKVDTPSESHSNTPNAVDTPSAASTSMPPPTEGVKKKGVKRTSAVALGADGQPKRGKPGPKKKPRLEDGTIDHSGSANRTGNGGGGAHRLGPKANQGAINAGLRALDRTGKPCRKWARGGFTMKTFTGVVWELPRWKAPPKVVEVKAEGNGTDSNSTSSKENKDNSQVDSDKSNSAAVDVEKTSTPSQPVDSPAPMAATAA